MKILRMIVLFVALTFVAAAVMAFRPSILIGVDGNSLGHSLGKADPSGVAAERPCEKQPSENWQCRTTDRGDNVSRYRVEVSATGCWEARRINRPALEQGRNLSGCVTLLNHLRLADRIFG